MGLEKRLITLAAAGLLSLFGGCAVVPAGPPYASVTVAPAPVYIAPAYPSPGPGWGWAYRPYYGWGWRHPYYGWRGGYRGGWR
ncbi:hypothetical protein [Azohydromonas australica]|uniref:hypothetical protein n=1 Tax=Azohydromonas australica TaxID=364039 RepID=UPI0004134DA7|nr:hypothetical protein [Azohydromonas australica]